MNNRTVNQQIRPFYLSASEEVNAEWSGNFATNLASVAARLGVPEALVTKVISQDKALQSVMDYNRSIEAWLSKWRTAKRALLDGRPANPEAFIQYPPTPKIPELPSDATAYVFAPHIQAANIILANPATTDADRQLLRLVKADGLPMPPEAANRVKADGFNYPLLKVVVENNTVTVGVTRGNRWKGKAMLLQVDRQGRGEFTNLVNTTSRSYTELITLPTDVQSAAWVYRAVYVDGTTVISDWCPDEGIVVQHEASPFMA